MRYAVALGASLLMVVGLGITSATPADASRDHRPSLSVQRSSERVVVLRGRSAYRQGRARVQTRRHGHWAGVAGVRIHRHRFTAKVHQPRHRARYRVVVRGHASRSVVARSATAAPSDACGAQPRKPDGSFWTCTFDDEFDGNSLDPSKWMVQTNFVTGTAAAHACYTDSPRNVSVSGGTLNLALRRESTPIRCEDQKLGATADYSSGSVMTYDRFSQQYGRFTARIKTEPTTADGLQETWWLWPDHRYDTSGTYWPAAGEIDVAETYSKYWWLNVPFLHYTSDDNGAAIPGVNTSWDCSAVRGQWNTYTLVWGPDELQIWANGTKCLDNTSGDPAFDKRYIMAFTQALGTTGNLPTAATPIPATMKVDYVRVWK